MTRKIARLFSRTKELASESLPAKVKVVSAKKDLSSASLPTTAVAISVLQMHSVFQ